METVNERISGLINELQIKKSEFADRIHITPAFVSQICSGVRQPSDRTISDICREFGIFREWLETGEGQKYKTAPTGGIEQELRDILGVDDPFAVAVLSSLAKMPPQWWDLWREELYKAVEAQKKSSE
jgi:transcriptional regulator with XRE-family HTH domain